MQQMVSRRNKKSLNVQQIPVARLIKPWAGLSKTETAAQGFCEVSRAKLMKQKV